MAEKLLLIDGNSIMNRGFFAIRDLTNDKGVHTNALLGFLNIFFKTYEEEKPSHIMVAFDKHEPTFRHKIYSDYKAGRHSMPDELRDQFPIIKKILTDMNIRFYEEGGIEADDIIGTMSHDAENEGFDVVILSGDRDLLQLATNKVKIRLPKTKDKKTVLEEYYAKDMVSTYGVTPSEFIDMKGLMGDSSDNIPGVKGIGEKTAAKLISEYKSIENLYEHIDEITPKGVKEKLITGKESAEFSKMLSAIKIDVGLSLKPSDLKVSENEMLSAEFNNDLMEYKLLSLMKKLDIGNDGESLSGQELKTCIRSVSLDEAIKDIKKDATNNAGKTYVGCAFDEGGNALYLSYCGVQYEVISFEFSGLSSIYDVGLILSFEAIKDLIGRLDLDILNGDKLLKDKYFDCSLAAYLIRYMKDLSIDNLSAYYLSIKTDSAEDFALKSLLAERLAPVLNTKLEEMGAASLYYDIELPTAFVLHDMEQDGIGCDRLELDEYGRFLSENISLLEEEIFSEAGERFNINSPKQLGEVLFEKLKLPAGKKTKSGYSTSADVLNRLKDDHKIVNDILKYRSYTKLKSTYVDGLSDSIKEDGRIHTTFNQTIAQTGRLSSSDPNLQNIPMRTDLGREIRKAFKPKEGYVFVDADYSQIELRVMAAISGDENLIKAFENSEDIHAMTASVCFNVPLDEVTPDLRRRAKAVNFGIIYGISSFGLGQDLDIDRKEAQRYIDQYFESYKGVKDFLDKQVNDAKEKGYVTTMFGRRREVPELKSANFMQRQFGERIAMNSPIQGTAADIIKLAMIRIWKSLKNEGMRSRLILQIHDELLIESPAGESERVRVLLKEAMEGAADLSVPLYIDMHEAGSLFDAK